MRMLRMLAFQFRQFISVPYFVQLMLVATLTTTLIQYLAQRAWGGRRAGSMKFLGLL